MAGFDIFQTIVLGAGGLIALIGLILLLTRVLRSCVGIAFALLLIAIGLVAVFMVKGGWLS